jgi:hypothetical protein
MKHDFQESSMLAVGEYACSCGARGTYVEVMRHIRKSSEMEDADVSVEPARDEMRAWLTRDDTAVVIGIPPNNDGNDFIGEDTKAHYLPIAPREPAIVPSPRSQSIAESFQDMLRQAFTAGLAAAQTAETFETWYQREILR